MIVKVRIFLAAPLCFSGIKPIEPIMLDSLLGYIWARDHGLCKTSAECAPENLVFPDLPIERIGKCYKSSAMFLPPETPMKEECFVKGTNWAAGMAKMGNKDMTYKIDTMWARGAQEKYWLLAAPYLDWYCETTEPDSLIQYLKEISKLGFLGSKRGAGFGKIQKIELGKDAPDYTVCKDGEPTRPLPIAAFSGLPLKDPSVGMSTYYAPYWYSQNADLCFLPNKAQYTPQVELPSSEMLFALQQKKEQYIRTFKENPKYQKALAEQGGAV